MTMTTTVRINAPVSPERLLDWITTIVNGDPATVERFPYDDTPAKDDGVVRIGNALGQGLWALCDVEYHPDGPLPTRTKYHEEDEPDWPPACVSLMFDTTYSFKFDEMNCADLHAAILFKLRQWLDQQEMGRIEAQWSTGEFISGWAPLDDLSQHGGDPTKYPERVDS